VQGSAPDKEQDACQTSRMRFPAISLQCAAQREYRDYRAMPFSSARVRVAIVP